MMTVGSIVRVKRSTYLLRKGDEGVVAKGNYPSVMTVQQSLIELVV